MIITVRNLVEVRKALENNCPTCRRVPQRSQKKIDFRIKGSIIMSTILLGLYHIANQSLSYYNLITIKNKLH